MKNDVFAALSQKSEKRSETSVKDLTEMFGLSADVKVTTLPISQLREKENHPFKVMTDEKLNALALSIKENGLMEPIIVRSLGNGTYEILAGHRRTRATQLNGENEIKAIVIKADDELANRIMISTNFQQRDVHLPSEVAKSYLIRYNDLKSRKRMRDENSNGWNFEDKIDKVMEKEFSTSKSKVYMYLRINYLMDDRDYNDGKYYVREISVPQGYVIDTEVKTFYVGYGETSSITWYNTPTQAQIQIIKKSADDNVINGLPAGSLLEGAVFEIYDRGGNIVDTIKTNKNGRAASKTLPLGLYTVRETQAPAYYSVNDTLMTANLEFSGQIVTFEVLNKSVSTGVSITKTGYNEVMPNNPITYTFKNIANTSSVPLQSFYWRDTLPSAIRAEKLVTGTYNQALSYKIVYLTNLSNGEYRTLNDNLSTTRNYALDIVDFYS